MSVMQLMPSEREWTVDDLDSLPDDDGLQYELADGILLVTGAPTTRHQRMSRGLFRLLDGACPPDLEVFFAPLRYQPSRRSSFQPDLLVVKREDSDEKAFVGTPLLLVEVLSPSTRAKDLVLKRALYEEAGVSSYWVIDPSVPSLVALELRDGTYVEVARVVGDEAATLRGPFPVTVVPSSLVG